MKKYYICIIAAALLLFGCGSKIAEGGIDTAKTQPAPSQNQAEKDFSDKFQSIRLDTMKLTTEKELPNALTEGGWCLKLADVAAENIHVYGYVDDQFGCRGVLIDRNGVVSYFPDIYYSSPRLILPKIHWDQETQMLVMSCSSIAGTGLSEDQLSVFLCSDSQKIDNVTFKEADLNRQLEKQITFQYNKEEQKVYIRNKKGELLGSEKVSKEAGDKGLVGIDLLDMVTFTPGKVTKIQTQVGYNVAGWVTAYYTDTPLTLSAPVTIKPVTNGNQKTAEFQVGLLTSD